MKMNENETEMERDYMGMIGWGRSNSTPRALFGSDIKTSHPITITISQASVRRALNKNWYHANPVPVVEVELSPVQWAEFLTSGNTEGVPCTITRVNGKRTGPVVCENVAERYITEGEEKLEAFRRGADDIAKFISDAIQKGAPMTKTRMAELLKMVEVYKHNTEANLNYFRNRFAEDMAEVVTKAKVEICATAQLFKATGKFEIPCLPGVSTDQTMEG